MNPASKLEKPIRQNENNEEAKREQSQFSPSPIVTHKVNVDAMF